MDAGRWQAAARAMLPILLGLTLGFGARARAADYPGIAAYPGLVEEPLPELVPRYFPRGDGEVEAGFVTAQPRRRVVGCSPWRVPIPTDAPDDPSYVGSSFGLGKPSYYGNPPGPGRDDPFDRPLRYCR